MASKSEKVTQSVTGSARAKIVKAFDAAYESVGRVGSAAADGVCRAINEVFPDGVESIADESMTAIVRDIGEKRGWKRDSLKARKSEILTILRASKSLPAATRRFADATGVCNWNHVVSLSRFLNAGKTAEQAAAALKAKARNSGGKKIDSAKAAKGYVAALLKRALKAPHLPRDLKTSILKLAVDQRLNVGSTAA